MADSNDSSEQWKPVPGYEGIYEVSDHGRVARLKANTTPFLLKPSETQYGYARVTLSKQGVGNQFMIHRLVLLAFVGPCPNGMEACHFPDQNRKNNNLKNLRWDTKKGNRRDMITHGTQLRDNDHWGAKYTEVDFERVHDLRTLGYYQREIGEWLGIPLSAVSKMLLGTMRVNVPKMTEITKPPNHSIKFNSVDFERAFDLRKHGCTQQAIAAWLGMSIPTVRSILSGKHVFVKHPRVNRLAVA